MSLTEQIITIVMCVIGTVMPRSLAFLLFKPGKNMPAYIRYLGRALPAAIFAMLVVYCLKNVSFVSGSYGIPELMVTTAIHLWKRNMMLSMVAGTAIYMLLVQVVFTG